MQPKVRPLFGGHAGCGLILGSLLSANGRKYLYKKVPANDSIAHKGRTVLSALNYKLNALCNVALYHDTPYGETHKNQLQRYYTTIYCDCQVRKVYI